MKQDIEMICRTGAEAALIVLIVVILVDGAASARLVGVALGLTWGANWIIQRWIGAEE